MIKHKPYDQDKDPFSYRNLSKPFRDIMKKPKKMEDEKCRECGGVGIIPSKIPFMRIGHACFSCSGTGKKAPDGMEGWEERFDKLPIVKTLSATQGILITNFFRKELADAREDEFDHVLFEIDCLGSTRGKAYNKVIHEVLDHLKTLRKEPHV